MSWDEFSEKYRPLSGLKEFKAEDLDALIPKKFRQPHDDDHLYEGRYWTKSHQRKEEVKKFSEKYLHLSGEKVEALSATLNPTKWTRGKPEEKVMENLTVPAEQSKWQEFTEKHQQISKDQAEGLSDQFPHRLRQKQVNKNRRFPYKQELEELGVSVQSKGKTLTGADVLKRELDKAVEAPDVPSWEP